MFFFLSIFSFASDFPKIPNSKFSPGHLCSTKETDFFEYRYEEKIPYCKRNVSSKTKNYIYTLYSIPLDQRKNFTIDHIIPLSLGGSNNEKNLWPEHLEIKKTRPTIEYDLYLNLKNGDISHKEAVETILNIKYNFYYYRTKL
jgi:hypothetical protein